MSANLQSAAEQGQAPDADKNGGRNPCSPRVTPKRTRYSCSCSFCGKNVIPRVSPSDHGNSQGEEDSEERRESERSVRAKKSLWVQEEESSPSGCKREKALGLGDQEEEELAVPLRNLKLTWNKKLHPRGILARVCPSGEDLGFLKKLHGSGSSGSEDRGWLALSFPAPLGDGGGAGDGAAAMRLSKESGGVEGALSEFSRVMGQDEEDIESRSAAPPCLHPWPKIESLEFNLLMPEEGNSGAEDGMAAEDDEERRWERPDSLSWGEIKMDLNLSPPPEDSGGVGSGSAAVRLYMENYEDEGAPLDGNSKLDKSDVHPRPESKRLDFKLSPPEDSGGAALRLFLGNVEEEVAPPEFDGESVMESPYVHPWPGYKRLDLKLSQPEDSGGAAAMSLDMENLEVVGSSEVTRFVDPLEDDGESGSEPPCVRFWAELEGLDLNLPPPEDEDGGGEGSDTAVMMLEMVS